MKIPSILSLAIASCARAPIAPVVAATIVVAPSVGCDDSTKKSENAAVTVLAQITGLPDKDMAAVREGLPDGAKALATELPTDAGDLKGTQEAIKRTREQNEKLRFAKSTFFVFTTADGVVVRSEYDPDSLADKNLFTAFPDLKKAADPKAGLAETFGEMTEMRRVKRGEDMEWVAAVPVVGKDGKLKGTFASGWSFRAYTNFLEQQAKRYLDEQAKNSKDHKIPVMYVYVIKGGKAYGGPETPDENAEAVAKLDLPSKVKNGPYKGHLDITGRVFGVAAEPAKALGDDAALAVVTSVY
jgi:hypothetical protein